MSLLHTYTDALNAIGGCNDELTDMMTELAALVKQRAAKGTMTVKLHITPDENGALSLTYEATSKVPAPVRERLVVMRDRKALRLVPEFPEVEAARA